jgi:hypothetical protein
MGLKGTIPMGRQSFEKGSRRSYANRPRAIATVDTNMRLLLAGLIGAIGGAAIVASGPRFHVGSIFFDGLAGYVGAAVAGALVAVLIGWALRKELGW